MNPAVLALEDGTVFEGMSFGAPVERTGEVVFNTAITGYQEVFTDPSYSGQIVVLTNPQIGNYGANEADNESAKPYIEGLVVREFSPLASNWRADETAQQFLTEHQRAGDRRDRHARAGAPSAIARRDARRAFRRLRRTAKELVERAKKSPSMAGLDLATRVSTPTAYEWTKTVGPVLAVGTRRRCRRNRAFTWSPTISGSSATSCGGWCKSGCRLTVVPAGTTAEDVLALKPHGVFLSNGPGDPEPLEYQAAQVRKLVGPRADFRHLPGPSDSGSGAGRQDLQAEVRASRRESSGAEQGHRTKWRSLRTITDSRWIRIR